jgi:hypothetical protein
MAQHVQHMMRSTRWFSCSLIVTHECRQSIARLQQIRKIDYDCGMLLLKTTPNWLEFVWFACAQTRQTGSVLKSIWTRRWRRARMRYANAGSSELPSFTLFMCTRKRVNCEWLHSSPSRPFISSVSRPECRALKTAIVDVDGYVICLNNCKKTTQYPPKNQIETHFHQPGQFEGAVDKRRWMFAPFCK